MVKIPVLEIFGPTYKAKAGSLEEKQCLCVQQGVISAVVGVILSLRGMAVRKRTFAL